MSTSAIILNWNELEVAKDSVRLLLKEPTVDKVIVSDNGSTDGSVAYFTGITDPKFTLLSHGKNMGASIARNRAIDQTNTPYIWLLDGDILYVRGSIAAYQKILDFYPQAFCVGQNSSAMLAKYGHNGVPDIIDADFSMDDDYTITEGFPMAWVQYGIFRGDLLRQVKFIETPPFDSFFYGFEDDWLYHEMMKRGYISLAVDKPLYYHAAHSGIKEIIKQHGEKEFNNKFAACKKAFEKKWGKNNGWMDTMNLNPPTMRELPKP